jgi:hypothetical protein
MVRSISRQGSALFLAAILAVPPGRAAAQEGALKITILEGDEAILNTRDRLAREAIVQIEDENNKPVAGAFVTFMAPNNGPSAVFADGLKTVTIETGPDGRAVLRGIRPNNTAGKYQLRIRAVKDGKSGSAVLSQSNALAAVGISGKALAILVAVGAAGAAGAAIALGGGSSPAAGPGAAPPSPAITITPGQPSVGRP